MAIRSKRLLLMVLCGATLGAYAETPLLMPNETQLRILLNDKYKDAHTCIKSHYFVPPVIVSRTDPYFRLMNYFVRVGFYTRENSEDQPNKSNNDANLKLLINISPNAAVEYKLTELGTKYFREEPDIELDRTLGKFCYGQLGVDSIRSVKGSVRSAPGAIFADVAYRYRMIKYQPWAENFIVTERYPEVARNLASRQKPFTDKVTVKLNGDQWVLDQ